MATNTGSNIHKALRVGSTVISRAFLGSAKIYDQLDYPTLDLNFALTKSLDPRITFTRASSGTYFDSSGVLQTATTNTPRFDHNPVTGASLGLLIEEQRTNLLLNSATLSTQSVTVTNVAHTLSFYGTGTIVLSGVHSATVNGIGAFPTRTTLTFTPTAGTLTLTVSGTVQYGQLTTGTFATSWIPTSGASATRASDNALITGTNFSSWYNQSEGVLFAEFISFGMNNFPRIVSTNNSTTNERINLLISTFNGGNSGLQGNVVVGGNFQTNLVFQPTGNYSINTITKCVIGFKLNNFAFSLSGVAYTDFSGSIPTVSRMEIGTEVSNNYLNGCVRRILFYDRRLANSELQILTT